MTNASATLPALADDPFGTDILTDPYDFHERLREAGPVVHLPRYDVYAMGRYEHVRAALTDHARFISSRGVGLSDFAREKPWRTPSLLLENDPPNHSIFRGVMDAVISPRTMRTLRTQFRSEAESLADAIVARGRFDVVTDIAEVYPLKVFPDALGVRPDGRENLLPYGALAFNTFGPQNALLQASMALFPDLQKWVDVAVQREALADTGFGASIWAAVDRGEITADQAPLLVRSLLSAGVDTTVYGIANTLYALVTNPGQWEVLHADPALAKFAFDEGLRYEAPVQTFFRTTVEPVEVAGTVIPADSKVLLFLGAANRDPRKWGENASELDIRRDAGGHVAFGMGVHQCVGQPVARLEAEMVLGALAERVSRIELDGAPVPKLNNTLKGWASIPVRITAA
jgi:4-methoxybenzoate monooxygenase (O-demethylating)